MAAARPSRWGARAAIALPYLWLALFFLAPLAIVVRISLSEAALAQPPYSPVFDLADWDSIVAGLRQLSFASYRLLLDDPLYRDSVLSSLRIASIATLILLVVGYPMAHALARAPRACRPGSGDGGDG